MFLANLLHLNVEKAWEAGFGFLRENIFLYMNPLHLS